MYQQLGAQCGILLDCHSTAYFTICMFVFSDSAGLNFENKSRFLGRKFSNATKTEEAGGFTYLAQWLNFKTFRDYIFSRENKPFKLLFQGPLAPMALLPRKSGTFFWMTSKLV